MKTYIVCLALLTSLNVFSQKSELDVYLENPLQEVFSVTSEKDKLSISGYAGTSKTSTTTQVTLERNQVLNIWRWKYFRPSISVLTVPFKVRREVAARPQFAMSGLTNVGLNFAMPEIKLERYFSKGTKSTHSLSAGFYIAPSVEELTPYNTSEPIMEASSKQLFITTALTIVYSFNNIQMTFIPIGCDIATNSQGKNWIYDGRTWFGFGIGIDPKIFSAMINKG